MIHTIIIIITLYSARDTIISDPPPPEIILSHMLRDTPISNASVNRGCITYKPWMACYIHIVRVWRVNISYRTSDIGQVHKHRLTYVYVLLFYTHYICITLYTQHIQCTGTPSSFVSHINQQQSESIIICIHPIFVPRHPIFVRIMYHYISNHRLSTLHPTTWRIGRQLFLSLCPWCPWVDLPTGAKQRCPLG